MKWVVNLLSLIFLKSMNSPKTVVTSSKLETGLETGLVIFFYFILRHNMNIELKRGLSQMTSC